MIAATIVTLTLNPSIDVASEAEQVRPTRKIRTVNERMEPGGGGVNVARVAQKFGVSVHALFLAGGVTGRVLDELLERTGLQRSMIAIQGDTRMSLAVHERSTGQEYRFVPEGPCVTEQEWQACLDVLDLIRCDYFVASGSLPRCAPQDGFVQICKKMGAKGARVILDTSGPPLRQALRRGSIFLVKPSRGEFERLVGTPLKDREAIEREASKIVASGAAQYVAVTMGRDGAILASRTEALFLPAVPVETRSAVGAGDSFLAAMICGLVTGMTIREAFRLGMAAGAAAALAPGSDLCHPTDAERLLRQVASLPVGTT